MAHSDRSPPESSDSFRGLLAPGTGLDLDARLQHVVGVGEPQPSLRRPGTGSRTAGAKFSATSA